MPQDESSVSVALLRDSRIRKVNFPNDPWRPRSASLLSWSGGREMIGGFLTTTLEAKAAVRSSSDFDPRNGTDVSGEC
jgi:hypothetical protein